MLLTIYDRYDHKKAELSPNDSSTQVKEIQSDNVLSLSFTLYEYVSLDVNDYVVFLGERYWLMEKYQPKQKNSVEWVYNIKMYGIESLIKRFLVLKMVDNECEPVFTLTAPPHEHIALIVQSINIGMDTNVWKVGTVEGNGNIVIDYKGKYCDVALKEIAEKTGTEFWVEGQTVNLCRCEHGEEIGLGYGKGLLDIEKTNADNVKFYTRLFPIGSSKNIDKEKYGYSRLQLPNKAKYIDVNTDKYGIFHHYESDAFADIYPKRIGVVSSVRSQEFIGEDGNPFKIFYFKDDNLNFDPNDYELPGLVKRVSFQEGSELAGLGDEDNGSYYFEVNYNSKTKEFEIITIWPYDDDTQLPNDILMPKAGDKYILWNISMPFEYYTLAEEEFRKAVDEYNEDNATDISTYKSQTDYIYIDENEIDLFIGRRVRLESRKYFPTGYKRSRITKITRKVNYPSQMNIEISDALSKGSMSKMGDDISDVKNYAQSIADSISLPDIIRTGDRTLPTDNNLFSARRTQRDFLSRIKEDTAQKKITFKEGVDIGEYTPGEMGGRIDGDGNAELLTMVVRHLLRSAEFRNGFAGEGWQLWVDEFGLSNLEIDRLTVRQIMTVFELLIERIRAVGGQIIVSAANGKIKSVEDTGEAYKIGFEGENYFVAHDLIRCQVFSGVENNGHSPVRGYWVEVQSVEDGKVIIPKTEFAEWSTAPMEGDECVLMGNTENPYRQSLISIAATEDGQPRIDIMDGVSDKNFVGCLRARFGNLDGIGDSNFPLDKQPSGNGLYADNAYLRGTFLLSTGEDIKTKFEVVEGKIESMVEGIRQDFMQDKGFLANPNFYEGMMHWETSNDVVFYKIGSKWIWTNNIISKKNNFALTDFDGERNICRIRNNYIIQKQKDYLSLPEITTNADGQKEPASVYVSFFYKVVTPGTLSIWFTGEDHSGFVDYSPFIVHEELESTNGQYLQYNASGLWNGTGDFCMFFTGEIHVYMMILTTDRLESLKYMYRTLFEQSANLVKISAAVFDQDEQALQETGLVIKPEGGGIYCQDANGNMALIGVAVEEDGVSKVYLKAENIKLEGLVTANENFKILMDGSVEAVNGKFSGTINATDGFFSGSLEAAGTFMGFNRKRKTLINAQNMSEYLLEIDPVQNIRKIDFSKVGTWLEIEYARLESDPNLVLEIPFFDGVVYADDIDDVDNNYNIAMGYWGNTVCIQSKSIYPIILKSLFYKNRLGWRNQLTLNMGDKIFLECTTTEEYPHSELGNVHAIYWNCISGNYNNE